MVNENDYLYLIAKRAKTLADMSMPQLRDTNGYNCDNSSQAQEKSRGMTRGELVEQILLEEYDKEFPREFVED